MCQMKSCQLVHRGGQEWYSVPLQVLQKGRERFQQLISAKPITRELIMAQADGLRWLKTHRGRITKMWGRD